MDTSLPIKVDDAGHRSSGVVEVPVKFEPIDGSRQSVTQDQGGGVEYSMNVFTEKSDEQQQLIPIKMES